GENCAGCKSPDPVFRCADEECAGLGMRCKECMVKSHQCLPFHWMEEWDGSMFWTRTLQSLGLRIQLGHKAGSACLLPQPAHTDFAVLHTNGIHEINLDFCGCQPNLLQRTQLLHSHWWPGTVFSPQSACTFMSLRQFHTFNCIAKIPAYDYYKGLETMTENRTREKPKDRYRTLLQCMVEWRHLKMCKRAGRGHDPSGVMGTQPGELAVECPACPHPDRNIPTDWKRWPSELQYLFYKFVAVDANFRLRNKLVSTHAKNPTLGDGFAYFVPYSDYIDWVKKFVDQTEISSCSGFAAIFLANLKNIKGLQTTGVGGCCCGRHGFWLPNGIGDLQKGERYCNMDYIFAQAVKGLDCMIILSYDIACQWGRNFWVRLEELKDKIDFRITEDNLIFLIPKFHLPAHQPGCQVPYSFHFTPGCGETHGEVIEGNWAITNKAASQTKEMGPGNRAVTLDDIFGHHNYRLLQNLDRLLGQRLLTALRQAKEQGQGFERFSEGLEMNVGKEVLDKWKTLVVEWEKDHSKLCPYETLNEDKNALKKVEIRLANEEHEAMVRGTMVHSSSVTVFLVLGLNIEEQQRQLEVDLKISSPFTPAQTLTIQKQQTVILRHIQQFCGLQATFMPRLQDFLTPSQRHNLDDPDTDKPERIKLFMPSELANQAARSTACAGKIWEQEGELRQGEAIDALNAVRQGLRARTLTNNFKLKNITGQKHNTRAQGVLRHIDLNINSNKIRYRFARNALFRLWGHGDWEKQLQILKDGDVRGLNERALNAEEIAQEEYLRERGLLNELQTAGIASPGVAVVMGDTGKRTLSWIWYDALVDSDDPEFQDALRVEWCKARARSLRWKEEVLLLCEELRRMKEFSRWKAKWWKNQIGRRENLGKELQEGLTAYALQHAAFEEHQAELVSSRWDYVVEHAKGVRPDIPNLEILFENVLDIGHSYAEDEDMGLEQEVEGGVMVE
ncbi:hypothetical protein BDP27DRAFT_1216848, partial [Rhodocollybia butyracea]